MIIEIKNVARDKYFQGSHAVFLARSGSVLSVSKLGGAGNNTCSLENL